MKHIVVTEVDAVTKIPCTVEPQRTGPSLPMVKNLECWWNDSSTWPVEIAEDGTYLRAPLYYCTCDDDADVEMAGVLEVLTEVQWTERRTAEHEARRPFESWISYPDTMTWGAPVARPINAIMNGGNVAYQWCENTLNWVPLE